ncbi:uncharacterized protein [Argopecten irradians]|uniref:uncharacterized protein n=1 Tax=Argopecten irradians TaxID=31199 RepID=UPI00371691BA
MDELQELVEKSLPSIILLTEIHQKNKILPLDNSFYKIPGFRCFTNNSEGRGVAIYISEQMTVQQVKFTTTFEEYLAVELKLSNGDKLLIVNIYRSPNSTAENFSYLTNLMREMSTRNAKHILITGDFNFPEINWTDWTTCTSENHISTRFLECVRDTFLYQHIHKPTRYREGQNPSILDLVFSNDEQIVNDVNYLPSIGRSDHILLSFKLSVSHSDNHTKQERRNYHKGHYDAIREELTSVNWLNIIQVEDMSTTQAWNVLVETITKLIEDKIPVNKTSPVRKRWKPHLDNEAKQSIRQKRRKWVRYLHCKTESNFKVYQRARNTATRQIRRSHYHYEKKLVQDIKDNSKLFWKYVGEKTRTGMSITNVVKADGTHTTNHYETANELNNYFGSVFILTHQKVKIHHTSK